MQVSGSKTGKSTPGAGGGEDSSQISSLLQVNDLDYRMAPALSVITRRSHARYSSTNLVSRDGSNVSIVLSTGSTYVNMKNSFLKFTVTVEATAGHSFSVGHEATSKSKLGAMALFEGVRITHSSGTVLDEVLTDLPRITYTRCATAKDTNWKQSVAPLFHAFGYPLEGLENGASFEVIYPLEMLSDLFASDQLMPSFLVSGSRIDLRLASMANAFVRADGGAFAASDNYTISNCALYAESYQLTDAVAKTLASISASSGLEVSFNAVHVNPVNRADTNFSVQITRALSRVNKVYMLSYKSHGANEYKTNLAETEEIKSDTSYYVQLGGQTIPVQAVVGQGESFIHSCIANNTLVNALASNHSLNEHVYGAGRLAITLESSSALSQSGTALSAQRVLVFNANLGSTVADYARRHLLVAEHVQLVTVYLDSVLVRS